MNDTELKLALAEMIPSHIFIWDETNCNTVTPFFQWKDARGSTRGERRLEDSELLHLCWLVEEQLEKDNHAQYNLYVKHLVSITTGFKQTFCQFEDLNYEQYNLLLHATWQQRVTSLIQVQQS